MREKIVNENEMDTKQAIGNKKLNYIQQTIWLDIQFITIQTDIDLAIAIEFSVHPLARF